MQTRATELADGTSRSPVSASLNIGVEPLMLVRAEKLWAPFRLDVIERWLAAGKLNRLPQHVHWNWALKALDLGTHQVCCSVEVAGRTEGLMTLIVTGKAARLPGAAGRPLVYVDYIETAPWNNPDFTATPLYRGVGLRLVQAAVQYSSDSGLDGRVGLHSLPQSESFYSQYCGLDSLGLDPAYSGLVYLELAPSNVSPLLAR